MNSTDERIAYVDGMANGIFNEIFSSIKRDGLKQRSVRTRIDSMVKERYDPTIGKASVQIMQLFLWSYIEDEIIKVFETTDTEWCARWPTTDFEQTQRDEVPNLNTETKCPVCNHKIRKRALLTTTFVGCMC